MHALPNCRLARRSLDIFSRLWICNSLRAGTEGSQETRDFFVFRLIVIPRPMHRCAKLLLQRFADGREIDIRRKAGAVP